MRAATNRGRLAGAALAVLLLSLAVAGTSGLAASPGRARSRGRPPGTPSGSPAFSARAGTSGASSSSRRRADRPTPPPRAPAAAAPRAGAPGKRPLTESGVYYLPFGQPRGVQGAGTRRAPRRRREPGDREPGRRAQPHRPRRPRQGALRDVPRPADAARASPTAICRSRDELRRRRGNSYRQESFAATRRRRAARRASSGSRWTRGRAMAALRPSPGPDRSSTRAGRDEHDLRGWLIHPRGRGRSRSARRATTPRGARRRVLGQAACRGRR